VWISGLVVVVGREALQEERGLQESHEHAWIDPDAIDPVRSTTPALGHHELMASDVVGPGLQVQYSTVVVCLAARCHVVVLLGGLDV
jgi:hypothetical protein